jgi:hypothetical protein
MAKVLPIRTDDPEDDGLRVRLDGVFYRFRLAWNTRGEYWTISMRDDTGASLIDGLRITLGVNMLRQFRGSMYPPGRLVAVDTSGSSTDPGRHDLYNRRVQIVYLTAAEVADAG